MARNEMEFGRKLRYWATGFFVALVPMLIILVVVMKIFEGEALMGPNSPGEETNKMAHAFIVAAAFGVYVIPILCGFLLLKAKKASYKG